MAPVTYVGAVPGALALYPFPLESFQMLTDDPLASPVIASALNDVCNAPIIEGVALTGIELGPCPSAEVAVIS